MSKKPYIRIIYPDASTKALQLTEAMVKRAPGKRVVETESNDPLFPDSGELFTDFIRCKTQTGVDLTLTLNKSSMDYALETLIRPNLTADERKSILGEESEPLFSPRAQAAQAPGQALDGESSADTPFAEQEAAMQSDIRGIISVALRDHFPELVEDLPEGKPAFAEDLARRIVLHIKLSGLLYERETATQSEEAAGASTCTEEVGTLREQTESAEKKKRHRARKNKADKADKADEANGDIEPGLLNDIEDGTEGGEE